MPLAAEVWLIVKPKFNADIVTVAVVGWKVLPPTIRYLVSAVELPVD